MPEADATTETVETPEGLRAAKDASDAANAALLEENRKLKLMGLFDRAQIDYEKGPGKLLFGQTQVTKLEDLIAEAVDYGLVPDPDAKQDEGDAVQQRKQQEMGELFRGGPSGGGNGDDGKGPNPNDVMLQTFRDAQRDSVPKEMAQTMALGGYFKAAKAGDPRTRFDKVAHAAEAAAYDGRG